MSVLGQASLTISNSYIHHLSAAEGGVFYLTLNSKLQLINTRLENNFAIIAGVMKVGEQAEVYCDYCSFKNNLAVYQGVFSFSGASYFNFTNSMFAYNKAIQSRSIG